MLVRITLLEWTVSSAVGWDQGKIGLAELTRLKGLTAEGGPDTNARRGSLLPE